MKNIKSIKKLASLAIALGAFGFTTQASAAGELILNEWNGVGPEQKLDECNTEGDHMFGCDDGNGGNWIELVVTEDHLNIQSWKFEWKNADGGGHANNGYLIFSDDEIWADLRAGTLITVRDDAGSSSDASYNPCDLDDSDWLIEVDALDPTYIAQAKTFDGSTSEPDGFKTDNDCWRGQIRDDGAAVVQSWVGENQGSNPSCPGSLGTATWNGGGISNNEVGKLEANPVAPGGGTNTNYKDGDSSTFGGPNVWSAGSGIQSLDALCNAACGVATGCCDSTSSVGAYGGAAGYDCYERNFSYYY